MSVIEYKFGLELPATAPQTGDYLQSADVDGSVGHAIGNVWTCLNRWTPTVGDKSITEAELAGSLISSTYISGIRVSVWKKVGTDFVRQGVSDTKSPPSTGYQKITLTPSASIDITVAANEEWYAGVELDMVDVTGFQPVLFRTGTDWAYNNLNIYSDSFSSTVPAAGNANNNVFQEASGIAMNITYTSDQRIETAISAPTANKVYALPRATSIPYMWKAKRLIVDDTFTATFTQEDMDPSVAATPIVQDTSKLDCGAAIASQNDLTDNGNTITLPATQDGLSFDIAWLFNRPGTTGDHDMVWQCLGEIETLISHAVKDSGARGTKYSYTAGSTFRVNGTYTLNTLEAGAEPIIIIGESHCVNAISLPTLPHVYPYYWGIGGIHENASASSPRMYLVLAKSGGKMLTHLYPNYKNATEGDGDGFELLGMGATWYLAVTGANDVNDGSVTDDATAWIKANAVYDKVEEIADDAIAAGDDVLMIGSMPASSAAYNAYEARSMRLLSRKYKDLATSLSVPMINLWPYFVTPGTESDAIPTFLAAYTTDGLHFNSTGGPIAQGYIITAWEADTIDDTIDWTDVLPVDAGMDVYWAASGAVAWDSDSWTWADGEDIVPDYRPRATDTANYNANGVGDCTLGAAIGSLTDNGSGNFTIVPGIAGIVTTAGYSGQINNSTHVLAVGTSGVDDTGGAIRFGAGRVGLNGGDVNIPSFVHATGDVVFNGAINYNAGQSNPRLSKAVVSDVAVVDLYARTGHVTTYYGLAASTLDVYGSMVTKEPVLTTYAMAYTINGSISIYSGATLVTDAAATTTYSIVATGTTSVVVEGSVDSRIFLTGITSLGGGGAVTATDVRAGVSSTGTITFGADAILPRLLLEAGAGGYTYVFAAGAEARGDVDVITGGGGATLSGTLILSGTADQDVDNDSASGLVLDIAKTAGTVTLTDGDTTLGADSGSITDNGSGNYTLVQGCDGVIIPVGYTDTFDTSTFDIVLGTDGLDASAASGATFDWGTGTHGFQGDVIVHASATWDPATSTFVFDGGTALDRIIIDADGASKESQNFVVTAGSYVQIGQAAGPIHSAGGTMNCWGDLSLTVSTYFLLDTSTFYSGSTVSGDPYLTNGGLVTIADGTSFTPSRLYLYGNNLTVTTGTLGCPLWLRNLSTTTITVVGSIDDVVFWFTTAQALTVDFSGEIHGDITESGSTGSIAATGTSSFDTTGNQSIDAPTADLSGLSFSGTKTSGTVSLLNATTLYVGSGDILETDINISATGAIDGAGKLRTDSLTLAGGGALDIAYLELVDFDAVAIPTVFAGSLGIISSGNNGDITPTLNGTYDWVDLELICEGVEDLLIDCATNDPTISISGDTTIIENSTGVVRWDRGTTIVDFDGAGDQTIALGFDGGINDVFNNFEVSNTGGTVTFTQDIWTSAYMKAGGATVVGESYIHLPDGGTITGSSTANAVGAPLFVSVGTATGSSVAAATGASIVHVVASAVGTSVVEGRAIKAQQVWFQELSNRRGISNITPDPVRSLELHGAVVVEPTAFEPDAATYRHSHYYNAITNTLYRRVVTRSEPGVVVAYWKKVSN